MESDPTLDPSWALETQAVRAGIHRTAFNEHAEALFLTSSFVFDNAAQAAARFKGDEPGYVYSRFSNPTVTAFEERLAALEGAQGCLATASGMSAILVCCLGTLQSGDHIVCSHSVFGSTVQLFSTVLARLGIRTTFVDPTDSQAWTAAVESTTRLFFVETPSNPLGQIADIAALAQIARRANALLVVDNCFCTPALQQPLALGADVVIHSATKYLDGQGRVLGGAILGNRDWLQQYILPTLRLTGPCLSAFNAWVLLKGLETLSLRMQAQSANALTLAQWLEQQPAIQRVYYPGLPSHPQHKLAMAQQRSGGAVLSFEVVGGQAAAWQVIDATRLCSITANLGDTKTTITHPATTTHGRLSPEARATAGIRDGLIRLAVGLEHPRDVQADLARGLSTL